MANSTTSTLESRLESMLALAQELRGIAFHIEHTNALEYGNMGCEHGKSKLLDDCGATREHDIWTLNKVASLFEKFFSPQTVKKTS